MNANEMSDEGLASHLRGMTKTGLYKEVPPKARSVFEEAIKRLERKSSIQKAIDDIAPWISASLSGDECGEYGRAANALLDLAQYEGKEERIACRVRDGELSPNQGRKLLNL